MQVELQRASRKNVPLFPIRIKFFGTIQQNKKGLSLRASLFFCFLSSNEVKSRFEPLYLATMPLTTSICFFRHAACAHQTPQREFAKAAVCLYQMFYPQRRCRRQSVYCTYLFFLHVFQTKFKRKKHLPPQVLQQKGIFHSKKIVFYSILLCFIHII